MKPVLFIRAGLLFLLIHLSISVFAQKFSYTYEGVTFKGKIEKEKATITEFDLKAEDVVIPSVIICNGNQYPVAKINTFLNGVNYLTVHLTIEEGIQEISNFCFNEFRKLQSLSLPRSIIKVGKNAIRMNEGLEVEWTDHATDLAVITKGDAYVGSSTEVRQPISERKESSTLYAAQNDSPKPQTTKKEKVKKENAKETASRESSTTKTKKETISKKKEAIDVDENIPVSFTSNEDMYCVIIANEAYVDVPEVQFASHDGEIFKEYCTKTLGIPEKQIRMFVNASYTDMKRALNWMDNMASVTDGRAKMVLYYAGHGIPNETDNSAYLIPVDGFPKDVTTCFKLSDIYARLGKMPVESVTVFLDACFSGVRRGDGAALIASRGVAVKAKKESLAGKLVVFSAASDDETAFAYQEKGHGMFTYFLLKKLQETKGKVTLGELSKYISSNVMKNSMLENDKLQTPTVSTSSSLTNKWESINL